MSDLGRLVFTRLTSALRLPLKDCQRNLSDQFALSSLESPNTALLQNFLQNGINNEVLEDYVLKAKITLGPAMNRFIINYLILVRDFDPWSILQSIDLMLNYYKHLTRCFENKDLTNILQQTMIDSTDYLIPMVTKVDTRLSLVDNTYRKFSRLEFFTEMLLSIFNRIIVSKSLVNESLISYLAIKIMKIYFYLEKPRLCNNILTNIRNLELDFNRTPASNQMNYRFLVGKLYFLQENFVHSFKEFQACLNLVAVSITPVKNLIAILRYLIPNGLLIGKLPNLKSFMRLIQISEQRNNNYNSSHFDVIQLYQPLFHFIKQGNLNSVSEYLFRHEQLFLSTKVLVIIVQKSRMITLRNLIRKIYLCNGNFTKNTLDFDSLILGLSLSMGQEKFPNSYKLFGDPLSINDLIVENILINLIDQQLIKANVFSRLRLVRFSKTNSFPDMCEVYSVKSH